MRITAAGGRPDSSLIQGVEAGVRQLRVSVSRCRTTGRGGQTLVIIRVEEVDN